MNKEYLKNPPKKYRPAPFWSWNEKLDVCETKNQVEFMEKAGLGGFFMHARGGLQTEYLKDEWFDNIKAASQKANDTNMLAWGYDENGWPSGFGSGAVNGLGVEYQQKYLRCEQTDDAKQTKTTVTNITYNGKNYHLYYDINPFYVDVLNKKVIAEFIKSTHEKYIDALGKSLGGMTGFFTDEPQVSRKGYPWSFVLEDEYKNLYGEEFTPKLLSLFIEDENYTVIRYRYWKLVRDLFTEAFNKQIQAWCQKNGQLYTGHMTCEEDFYYQMMCNGSAMPNYEFMDIPGMDHLGRNEASTNTIMQLTSAANQLGKKQILSETFALCGWNVSFEELRWIYEAQMVRGVNYLCQHLQGYSLRGIRKRDYPASLYRHQPWWKNYRTFNDMVSRIGMLIAEGRVDTNILLLNSIEGGWLTFAGTPESAVITNTLVYHQRMAMTSLENAGFNYHLGDNKLLERHGSVEDGLLRVGTQKYSLVIVPPTTCLGRATYNLLKEFKNAGGKIIFTEVIPTYIDGVKTDEFVELAKGMQVAENDNIGAAVPSCYKKIDLTYEKQEKAVLTTVRYFDDEGMAMYYLVNPNQESVDFTANIKGKSAEEFSAVTGKTKPLDFEISGDKIVISGRLAGRGSAIYFVYNSNEKAPAKNNKNLLTPLNLKGEWKIKSADNNALTLDYCDLYINGELKAKNLPINDVQEIACSYEKKVKLDVVFNFNTDTLEFNTFNLALETPSIFEITVNGKSADKTDLGYYHDIAFRLINIKELVTLGSNEIRLTCDFEQSAEVYKNMKNSLIFESEKNKLTYDMEIEAVYLVGDFGVKAKAPFEKLERRALKTNGDFVITQMPKTVNDGEIATQGFPFFAGSMTFEKEVDLSAGETENRSVAFSNLCSTVTEVKINGADAGTVMWQPYEVNALNLLRQGKNSIEITVTGNLRNLLGPHHLSEGECFAVAPRKFFHNSPIWSKGQNPDWVDSYCFVEFGLFFK